MASSSYEQEAHGGDRGAVLALENEGYSWRELAAKFETSESTLRGVKRHFHQHGTVKKSYGKGRPPGLNTQAEDRLIRAVQRNPKVTSAQLAETENVSPTTIRKVLHSRGFNSRVCRIGQVLTGPNVEKRKRWADELEGRYNLRSCRF
jgi:transposase